LVSPSAIGVPLPNESDESDRKPKHHPFGLLPLSWRGHFTLVEGIREYESLSMVMLKLDDGYGSEVQ
jgi:hypothetical protein